MPGRCNLSRIEVKYTRRTHVLFRLEGCTVLRRRGLHASAFRSRSLYLPAQSRLKVYLSAVSSAWPSARHLCVAPSLCDLADRWILRAPEGGNRLGQTDGCRRGNVSRFSASSADFALVPNARWPVPAEAHTLPLTANGFSHKMPDYPVRYIMLTLYLHALESTAAWSGTPITVRSQAPARDVLLHFRAPSSLITMMDMMDSSFLNGPLESYVAAEYAARTAASTAYMAFSAYSAAAISLIMMSCLLVLVAERAGDGLSEEPRGTVGFETGAVRQCSLHRKQY